MRGKPHNPGGPAGPGRSPRPAAPVDHYFSSRPEAPSRRRMVRTSVRGLDLTLETDASVFSKSRIDPGTRLLVESISIGEDELVLDLGCGYGPVGIAAALLAPGCRVIMVDVNERACELARLNARANGVHERVEVRQGWGFQPVLGTSFTQVLCNPPIRAGKSVVFDLIRVSFDHLAPGGSLSLVARTSQGARSIRREMARVFGNATDVEIGSGYRVMRSVRPPDPEVKRSEVR